jgi:hypothetical protein
VNAGGKKDPDLVGALQRGALDVAADVLKKIHDTRDAGLRAAAAQRLTLADSGVQRDLLGIPGLAYELAQLQGEMLSRVLGIHRRNAEAVQRRVEQTLGLRDHDAPAAALRGKGKGPEFRLPFRVKNSLGVDGALTGALKDGVLTDAEGDRHVTSAALELPSVLPASGVLPAGTVTLLTLVLTSPLAAAGARLQGRYVVRVGDAEVLTLHIDLAVE